MNPNSSRSRVLLIAVLTVAATAFAAPPAHGGPLAESAVSCDSYVLEQPFLQFLDPFEYVLAPKGTFERGASGWTLTGRARVVSGNETYYVHGSGERRSLSLRPGSSATSPAMCAGLEYPTLRMFAVNRRSALSTLQVEVLFEDALGEVQSLPIALLTASRSWEPTVPMPVVANLLPLLPENRTAIAFRFSPQDAVGDWRIDDVYVDPYRAR